MCCLSSETSALNGTSSPNMQGVSAPSSLGEFLLLTSDLTFAYIFYRTLKCVVFITIGLAYVDFLLRRMNHR